MATWIKFWLAKSLVEVGVPLAFFVGLALLVGLVYGAALLHDKYARWRKPKAVK